jgi:hypothetical protein
MLEGLPGANLPGRSRQGADVGSAPLSGLSADEVFLEAVFDGSSRPQPQLVIVALQRCPYVDDFALHSLHGPQSYRLRHVHGDGDRECLCRGRRYGGQQHQSNHDGDGRWLTAPTCAKGLHGEILCPSLAFVSAHLCYRFNRGRTPATPAEAVWPTASVGNQRPVVF